MTDNLRTARGGMGVLDLTLWLLEKKRREAPPWEAIKVPVGITNETEAGPGLLARINFDQWIVDCPFCNSAELADPEDPRFFCINCYNAENGGRWIPVQWPPERFVIETILADRPEPDFRHWDPGTTVEELMERNLEPFHHSWTAPRTWVASAILTAAQLNTHLRDNLLETLVAKVTTAGDIGYATAATTLARLALVVGGILYGGASAPAWLAVSGARSILSLNSGATAPTWGDFKHVVKAADQSITNDAAVADDQHLTIAVGANESWIFELSLFAIIRADSDLRITFTFPAGGTFATHWIGADELGALHVSATANGGPMHIEGLGPDPLIYPTVYAVLQNAGTAGNVLVRWAQFTATGNTATLKKGTMLRASKVAG